MEQIEFDPGKPGEVVARMDQLARAGDGWINLLPGVEEGDAGEPRQVSVFSALFGSAQAPVTMTTWMPPKGGRGGAPEVNLGIMHPKGRRAVAQLADEGVHVPAGWRVRQDHPRRGLILLVPVSVPHKVVLEWAIRAGGALTAIDMTGSWQARVYLPIDPGSAL